MGYATDINTADYLYMAPVIITETNGTNHVDFPFRLELDSSTFNFDFARSDGKDLRLAERSNGQQVLNMWISSWTTTSATIRFNLPSLLAGETKTLYAFWGNSGDAGISDKNTIGLLFIDEFNSFNSSVWTLTGSYTIAGSEIALATSSNIITKATNLFGINRDWTLECKFRTATTPVSDWAYTIGITTAGQNAPGIYLYYAPNPGTGTNNQRDHNFWTCAYAKDPGTAYEEDYDKGFSLGSNHLVKITYVEDIDTLTYYMTKDVARFYDYKEYTEIAERVCSGNTRPTGVRLYGRSNSSYSPLSYIDYVLVEAYNNNKYTLDTSALYRELENVEYEFSGLAYGPDITDTYYSHETTLGGDPTKLSDNNLNNVFETTSTDGEIVIDFSKQHGDLTTNQTIHFDNGHTTRFAAVKLSDNDTDKDGNYWFQSTTASGYAAITYTGIVGSVAIKGFGDSSAPKDFRFAGSDEDPRFSPTTTLLASGTLGQTSDWQTIYFSNSTEFDYYILYFDSTYGANTKIQEWRMYKPTAGPQEFTAARLKLRPGTLSGTYKYFPKYITFYGNNDLDNWVELIPIRKTYTPDTTNWQEYALTPSEFVGLWEFNGELYYSRYEITIDSSKIDENLENFPVMVALSSDTGINSFNADHIFDTVAGAHNKIVIADSDDNQLYVEVEYWDYLSKTARLWVKVPAISLSTDTKIYLYYASDVSGNATYVGSTGSIAAQNVWNSNYKRVWHLRDSSLVDSTSNNVTALLGTGAFADSSNDILGTALYSDNEYSAATFGLSGITSLTNRTVEFLAMPTALGTGDWANVMISQSSTELLNYRYNGNDTSKTIDYRFGYGAEVIDLYELFHVAVTNNKGYLNGVVEVTGTPPGINTSDPLRMSGRATREAYTYAGYIAELRVSDINRSTPWMNATYHSNMDNLVSFSYESNTAISSYRAYKLVCSGNWNNTTDKIIIAEWELNELL